MILLNFLDKSKFKLEVFVMNKKLVCLTAAAAMAASYSAAFAENNVKVIVDNSEINYEDQQPIIENDRTLIPVRGAFEAMGGTVEWDGDTQTVTVRNNTNTKIAKLTIGSDVMQVFNYKTLLDVDKEEIKLDVPAKLINDRTMLPLRAVGEAMGASVAWDEDTYTASITTKTISDEKKASMAEMYLTQGTSENADEIVVDVNIKNIAQYENSYVAGVTLGLNYDKEALEFVSCGLYNGDNKVENALGVENAEFDENRLKAPYITVDEENAASSDGVIMKVVFKKLKEEGGKVSLSTSYHSRLGYDTDVLICKKGTGDTKTLDLEDGLIIDSSELEVK